MRQCGSATPGFGSLTVSALPYDHRFVACTTVLFDLDGTLTDSEPGIIASFRYALAGYGLEADDAAIRRWIGPPLRDGLSALGIPPDQVEAAVTAYRSYFGETGMYDNRLYEGAAQMLVDLRRAGVTLGLATSKLEKYAHAILAHFGIIEHFRVVAGASTDGSRLSKEAIVDHALVALGRPDPATVAFVGDREHDMRAAVHHRLHAVGAGWGYGDDQELTEAGSEVIADSPAALIRLLLPAP